MSVRKILNAAAGYADSIASVSAPSDTYFDSTSLLLTGDVEVDPSFANVSLLIDGNTLTDKSNNKLTVTANGNAAVASNFKKFGAGSITLDGNGDYLTIPQNTVFNFGTNNFTVEAWIYRNSSSGSGYETIFGFDTSGQLLFQLYQNQLDFGIRLTTSNLSGVTVPLNVWTHLALCRNSNVVNYFQNGVLIYSYSGTYATSNFTNGSQALVGCYSTSAGYFNGYIDDLRITNGVARYTANFTPPVKALPTHEILDSSVYRLPVTAYGNARIDTATKKYGTGSMYFDGSGDAIGLAANSAFSINGDYTIEAWVYPSSTQVQSYPCIFANKDYGAAENMLLYFNHASNANKYSFYIGSSVFTLNGTIQPGYNVWNHVALVKRGSTISLYVNGVLDVSGTYSSTLYTSNPTFFIGNESATRTITWFTGYIDDFRITKGSARYTANFTPPTAALPTIPPTIPADPWWGNVSLLLDGNTTDAYDPYWQNVSLMLTGDDFIDWSNQHSAVTNNGTVTLSTATKKFNSSSIALSGSNYLTVPYSTTLFDWWVSDFTLECWVNPTTLSSFQQTSNISILVSTLIGNMTSTSTLNYWSFGPLSNGTVRFYYYSGSGFTVTSTATISATQWSHIAMTKNSSGIQIWVNGVGNGYTAISGSPQSSTSTTLTIGEFQSVGANGYIADLRITKGVARYTANFTPPTAALPAFKIQDRTQNALTLTPYGNVQLSTDVMKNGTGSMFFDGVGDNVSIANTPYLTLGSGDFTIEGWFNQASTLPAAHIFTTTVSYGTANNLRLAIGGGVFNVYTGNTGLITPAGSVTNGTWYHFALVRTGTTLTLYSNGVSIGTTTTSVSFIMDTFMVGGEGTYPFNGYIDDFRVTKGYARYTQNFTPPSQSFATQYISTGYDPNYADVSLLLNGNGTNGSQLFTDLSGTPKTITAYGNAQINTAVKKYGTGSIAFDGTGDYLTVPSSAGGFSGDFTIEGWFYYNSLSNSYCPIFDARNPSSSYAGILLFLSSTGIYLYRANSGLVTTTLPPTNSWFHFAVTRKNATIYLFINGIQAGTATDSGDFPATTIYFGAFCDLYQYSNAYLDDFRITKGVARYTTNFTPPTYQLPTDTTGTVIDPLRASTSLLLRGNGTNGSTSFTDESPNGLTVTNNGSVTVNTTTKKYGTGSMYFDGTTTGYLTANNGMSFTTSDDLTVELWFYKTSNLTSTTILAGSNGTLKNLFYVQSTQKIAVSVTYAAPYLLGTTLISLNTWYHYAYTRKNGIGYLFLNGILEASGADAYTCDGTSLNIGANKDITAANMFPGYIDDFRITKGYARYTTNFTPPTYEDPIVTGTVLDYNYPQVSLLLNGDGTNGSTTFTDLSSSPKTITNTGSVAVNTTTKKFGTGSIYIPASSYLSCTDNVGLGSNDFTIELWIYNTQVNWLGAFSIGATAGNDWAGISFVNNGVIYISTTGAGWQYSAISCGTISQNAWQHFAFVRTNGNFYVYNNGTLASTTAITGSLAVNGGKILIGVKSDALTSSILAYIDDFRITKGVARYTANFTPPNAPLPTSYS